MSALRSLVFNMFMFVFTSLYILFFLCPLLLFPRAYMTWAVKAWAIILFGVLKRVVGLDYRITGEENILTGPVIYSSKHQSAWDTAVFLILLDKPAYIVKEELTKLPFYGAVAQKAGVISVNRDLGAA
ncbi:MAG TPA: 1-acyl-sn-glycerol-3-phosphate acyltransferase, partial [Rhodospirillales bacterium]|nr:1-acyl-sn-glycerol-3-phosphate acyltransferase [Rhodospirillales bacterium]